jgi:hypothetical protein
MKEQTNWPTVRLGQDWQAIKSSIIGPRSFLSFQISENKQQKRGYPGRVRG